MTTTMKRFVLLLGAATLAVAPLANAQEEDPAPVTNATAVGDVLPVAELGLVGGAHFFEKLHGLGRYQDSPEGMSPDHGLAFGLRLTFNLSRWVAIEGEGLIIPTNSRDDATSMLVLGYRGQLLVNLVERGRFRPFLLVGYGGLTSKVDDTNVVPDDTDGAFHAGVGAKLLLTDRVGLRVDGRALAPPSIFSDIVTVGDEIGFDGPDYEALLSVYMTFGGEKPVAAPPPAPAPDLDPDQDGIAGALDRCPNDPEDKDGFEDDDGCPDPDNDADGILDGNDKCPLQPENVNGADDEDGCPEVDTDGDGFFGTKDSCPEQPETKNGFQDGDGCPDEVPTPLKKFTGVIEGINFRTGKAEVLRGSHAILDRAVAVLKEFSDVKLEIGGHTDDRGSDEFNRDLSQRRADAVKDYLVAKGIAPERLNSVGHGEGSPVGDNATSTGRAKNRRTEFKLVAP